MDLRKFGVRTLVTVVVGPFIILCAWKGQYLFFALMTSIVVLGMYEFYNLSVQKVAIPERFTGIATGIGICFLFFFNQMQNVWILIAASFFLLLVLELFRNKVAPILNVATTFMGVIYVAFFLGFLILIRELGDQVGLSYEIGGELVILVFLCIWICDSAAYILGAQFGRTKLFERVSPNKTVEGTLFGFGFAVLTAYVCYLTFLTEIGLVNALTIGAICGSVGQVSDLLESLFKRDAHVKDSSNLIPGHGGILDRFDSEILAAPVVYFYLYFIVF
ncbi:phosphatidate cytidylyltransferase [candidate division KSB1 bacterium]|nr:phosphatidate cytidylyltransferase [candidate division KSB1 bacterium]NIR72800.1 phosphatidate cytidylyltransferase [candidate division KSB1 bacterium]NIS28219.1 phosphatidate cytidylyltransferase [candidate division KSB1 bacterium]NIT75110.1 phosphatidate cytidylyltransferase [candidate division KSB1 bacterium]NIU28897.1 phosphatidate cytidylyltransferase [candidate division KSB1 bacterium]